MTMAEIMMVVAIIGILWAGIMSFDFEWATDKERRDRFATGFASVIRHAKTAAVSGRTAINGGCGAFAVEIGEKAMTGSSVNLSDTGAVSMNCGIDLDASLPAPIFWDSNNSYYIPAITAYDKSGGVTYRVANPADYPSAPGNLADAKSVVIFIKGSELRAYPMNCTSDVAACPDLTKNQAVKLKVNLAYRQSMNTRVKDASKDVWIDLRTGNIEVANPVGP